MQSSAAETARLQAEHYDRIAADYAVHYGDKFSRRYRDDYINKHLFEGIELEGRSVLEAMCGSGETTGYLLQNGAQVQGLDVSEAEITKFESRWPAAKGVCGSIFETEFADDTFDVVVVVGGLHHLHPHLSGAVREMHRILRPGGHFCFAEPHKGSLFDSLRQFWYRHDDLFANNEEAIDVAALTDEFSDLFEVDSVIYSGNVGYLFVLNSMVFRIPQSVKKIYSPLFLRLEGMIEPIQNRTFSCMSIARWRKK